MKYEILDGLTEDDYIAFPSEELSEGMTVTRNTDQLSDSMDSYEYDMGYDDGIEYDDSMDFSQDMDYGDELPVFEEGDYEIIEEGDAELE